MSIGSRLIELRKDRGYSRKEFAEFIGIPVTTLRNYELGKREPGHPFIVQMAYMFNVSTDYLLCLTDDKSPIYVNSDLAIFNEKEISVLKKYRALDEHGKDMVDIVLQKEYERRTEHAKEFIMLQPPLLIPYYGHVASAGTGQYVFDDIPPEMIEIENNMENMHVDFAIGVNGDSMEPTYHDGDTLLIKKQPEICTGEVGIFMINGEAYVKELGDGVLISHNKKYKDINLTENTVCIGKVLGKL